MKMKLFLYTVLIYIISLVSCGNKENGETSFSPDLSFSSNGTVAIETGMNTAEEIYTVTISRTTDLAKAVDITLGVDNTLIPAGKELMPAEYYEFPLRVNLPAETFTASFEVKFYPKALKEEKGNDSGKYVLPIKITAVNPSFTLNADECSIVLGLNIEVPVVTVSTGQTFLLSFGAENDNTETIDLTAKTNLEFDFTKINYEVYDAGVAQYNTEQGDSRILLPSSAYSIGEHSFAPLPKRLTTPVSLTCSKLPTGGYVLPLKMKSDEKNIEVKQEEVCFISVDVIPGLVGFIVNGDFSETVSTTLYSNNAAIGVWRYTGGWNTGGAVITYDLTAGVGGSPCIVIAAKSGSSTDVMVSQKVTGLNPDKAYKVTAQIKTEGITKGRGANIAEGPDLAPASDGITGTKNWTTETFYVPDPVGGEIQISLRLGYNSSDSDGTAYFDNVVLSEDSDIYIRQSDHVKLMIPKNKIPSGMADADFDVWLGNLDKAYLAYKELFSSRVPWDGIRMKIRSAIIGAWAYAGNPIQWNTNYITSELTSVKNKDDWSFGIMHEIGHNFASHIGTANYAWNWDEEVFANFRMTYVLRNVAGAKIYQNNVAYTSNISDYYKLSYNSTIGKGIKANGDAIQYTLQRIVDKFGWQPIIDAFDHLYTLSKDLPLGSDSWTKWQKFNFFIDTLNDYVPGDESVWDTYTSQELNLIQSGLTE